MERVLVVGGSGYVGSLVLPLLAGRHRLRVFDLRPPESGDQEFVAGDVTDVAALRTASAGCDALLYLAMGSHEPVDGDDWASDAAHETAFDVSVKGVYLALRAAHEAGITQAVYASSLSVYRAMEWGSGATRYFDDEDLPPDAQGVYGLTKRLGEEVCRNACRAWGMSVNVLRLCLPMPRDRWLTETRAGTSTIATAHDDVARAFLAALASRGAGFQAFTISGDYEQGLMSLRKAKALLDWEPLARPKEAGQE